MATSRRRAKVDVVFADDYFQYFYDRGQSGGFAKAAVDGQILRDLEQIDPRAPSEPTVFTTSSTLVPPCMFAVTSPIMLEIQRDRVSLVLFPFSYKMGRNRMDQAAFAADVQTRQVMRLPLE